MYKRDVGPAISVAPYCVRHITDTVLCHARTWWLAAGSNRFIHVPIKLMIFERNQVAPGGDLRLSVL